MAKKKINADPSANQTTDDSDIQKNAPVSIYPAGVFAGTKAAMIWSMEQRRGIVVHAAKLACVHRDTHYQWIKDDPEYLFAIDVAKQSAIDHVESKLFELIDGVTLLHRGDIYKQPPDTTACIFYLKTIGKARGYVEKNIIEHSGVEINIIPDDKE